MQERRNYIQLKLFSIPVLVMYSLFFTVQVFFNFDTALTNAASQHAVLAQKKDKGAAPVFSHTNQQKQGHSKIRLSKRFQPANAPLLNPFSITIPVVFIERLVTTIGPDPFHASPFLTIRSLRGPPAVVYHFA